MLFFSFFFALMSMTTYAQGQTITGKVIDSDGYEIIGGSVTLKGAAGVGTVTDINGNYSIHVTNPTKDVLVFSYVGMTSQEVKVNGRRTIDITLQADAVMLDEVVAIGYATVKRKDLTGSVTSVNSKELSKVPTSDVTQALAGRMAGVHVQSSEGGPGASISIRVRGGISITQSNDPLYIIDGFPDEDGLNTLDPAEIETIDVLKDASATAIYGARGANGVVVITTKSGKKNQKAVVSFDTYVGFKKISKKLDVLSPKEFVKLDYERRVYQTTTEEAFNDAVTQFESLYGAYNEIDQNYSHMKGIDWQDETLGRTALTQNYRVSVQGGSEKMNYNMAYSYYDEEGAMIESGTKKHNISFNMKHDLNKWLSFNTRISYDQLKVYGMGTSENGDRFNKMQHILQYRPTGGIYFDDADLLAGEDPIYQDDSGNVMQNPLISAMEETKDREYRTFQANAGITVKLWKGLQFRNTTGMRYQTRRYDIFYGDQSVIGKRSSINGSIENREYNSFQTSNVLSYHWKNKRHDLTAMIGQEYVNRWNRGFKTTVSNFPNDEIGLADLSLGIAGVSTSNENYDDKLLSFFARTNYSFMDKYLLTASVRADGSSKFGKNNRWGYFPAFSAAWRLGEEEFIKDLELFSDLKLRIGYGLSGNNRVDSYASLAILSSVDYPNGDSTQSGYASSQIPNPDLKWEANKTFNFGLDFGFFNQRLTISPEFYINRSSNLLLNAKLPTSSGYSSMMINAGETENKGIDLTINSVNVQTKDFVWETSLTFSHNKNTVKKLTGESVQLWEASFGYSQNTHIIAVGQPLGQFYGYVADGLYQVKDFDYNEDTGTYTLKDGVPYLTSTGKENVKPGMWKFKNVDGSEDCAVDENDKTVIGKATPKFYGGINNNFTYKNFDLSIFLTYSYGNDVLNATKLTNSRAAQTNKNALALTNSQDRWVLVNNSGKLITDPDEMMAYNQGKTMAALYDLEQGDMYISSWAVEDGSFLKLSNITLGYTFPRRIIQKCGLSKLRVYATANNLATWTKYSGFDPEVSTMGSGLTPGVDFGAYPKSRSFVFGINVSF